MRRFIETCVAVLAWTFVANVVPSQATVVNFDSIDTGSAGYLVSESVVDDYLSNFGVTLTDETEATLRFCIESDSDSGYGFQASSVPNMLYCESNSSAITEFTLSFATPLSSFSFTRCEEIPIHGGTAFPDWSATAYNGTQQVGSTVGESAYSLFSPNIRAAQTYTFTGYITSVTFYGNGNNFAAYSFPAIDDLTLTAVPEPGTWLLLASALVGLLFYARQKRK